MRGTALAIILGAGALLSVAACASTATESEASSVSETANVAASSSPGTYDGPDGSTLTLSVEPGGGKKVVGVFEIREGLTDGLMRTQATLATMDILNAVKEQFPDVEKITVKGKLGDSVMVTANYSQPLLSSVDDFKSVSKDQIWKIADSAYLDPAFPAG